MNGEKIHMKSVAMIQNRAYIDIKTGNHIPAQVLIQIVDHDMDFPTPAKEFKYTYQYKFWDDKDSFTDAMARDMTSILLKHLTFGHSVVVHCVAGLCRSGAVAEVGTIIGYKDTGARRIPNVDVKIRLLKALDSEYYYE